MLRYTIEIDGTDDGIATWQIGEIIRRAADEAVCGTPLYEFRMHGHDVLLREEEGPDR